MSLLPQDIHPLLSLVDDGVDVLLPFEVLGIDGAPEPLGLHNVHWGILQHVG